MAELEQVGPIGPTLPETERQARALATAPEGQRAEVWQEAVDWKTCGLDAPNRPPYEVRPLRL